MNSCCSLQSVAALGETPQVLMRLQQGAQIDVQDE